MYCAYKLFFLFGLPRRPPQEPLRILLIAYVPDQCSISAVSIQAYQLNGDDICGGPSQSQNTDLNVNVQRNFRPWNGINDSLGFWILRCGFWIPGYFNLLSVEPRFWVSIDSWVSDSLSCIPDSKAQDFGFHKQKFPGFRNSDSLALGEKFSRNFSLVMCHKRQPRAYQNLANEILTQIIPK